MGDADGRDEGRWRGWIYLGELLGVGSGQEGKMGQKQCGLAEDYGDGLGDERGSVGRRRRMNKGPFGRQCDISKLLAYP